MTMQRTPGRLQWHWLPAAVFLLGVLSIGLLVWTDRINEIQRRNYIVVGALMDLQLHASAFHLGLEEFLGGNPAKEMKSIWKELDAAAVLSDTLLHGGDSEHGILEEPLTAPEFRSRAEALRVSLVELKAAALERLRTPEESGYTSARNQRFDSIFERLLTGAAGLERTVESERHHNMEKARRLQLGILTVWSLIVALAVLGLWNRELRRKLSERALRFANDQLQAQAEELRGHREHLAELVERKTEELLGANRRLRLEIEEREHVEEALCLSARKYKDLFDSTLEGIYQIDGDGQFVLVNPAAARMLGYDNPEELIGRSALEFAKDHGVKAAFLAELRSKRKVIAYNMSARTKRGDSIELEHTSCVMEDEEGNILGIEGIMRDVSRQRGLEAQLRHAQKMEAVGQLAGGIAHDFNNILTAIIGFTSLAEMNRGKAEAERYLGQVLAAADRAAQLTRGLLAFGRKQHLNPQPANLNSIVTSVENLLARLISEEIELKTCLAVQNLTIMADSSQLDQVLINLATNARDAMPEGGLLTIETVAMEMTDDFLNNHGYGKSGRYAMLTVSDSGVGLDEKTKSRIFEPFFTTKEVGKGTGLGLAIVYGIIKQHNGFINVYSEPGKGTTFRIYLPLVQEEIVSQRPTECPGPVLQGTETVLVVEDNQEVRYLTRSLLEEFNYRVIEAVDGVDALDKFISNQDAIRLVIMDVIMPRMNGREAYARMNELRSGVKVLFTSGYTGDILHEKGILAQGISFISKPATPQELLKKIRETLDT
jgi:PAS domain S-box-containing protein